MKISAVILGGGVTAIALEKPLSSLFTKPKITNQFLVAPQRTIQIKPVESVASTFAVLDSLSIPKFENQLTSPPPVYQPNIVTAQGQTVHEYTVGAASFKQQILPPSMNLLTEVWGYGGSAVDAVTGASLGFVQNCPGPTFEAVRGTAVKVKWQNNLTAFLFPVDPTIHWANPNNTSMSIAPFPTYPPGVPSVQSPVPFVTHLHGGENQSFSDGGPNQWFTSNGQHGSSYYTFEKTEENAAVYYYPNKQPPTTLWYHDHALGLTRLNVASGLAGFYIIREPQNGGDKVAALLPTGKYEMPLVIQDRTFNSDGSLNYPSVGSYPAMHPYWVNSFQGNAIMVNGKVWPNMNVAKGQYRFRILNGSNSRFYLLKLSNRMHFTQIGSDGGYLKAPTQLTSSLIAPAERIDVIIDFSKFASGEKIVLQNTALLSNSNEEKQTMGQIMQFTVTDEQGTAPFSINSAPEPFNPTLAGNTFPTLPETKKQRTLTLFEITESNGVTSGALLDGQNWDAPVSETPELGTTEEWVIVNPTMNAHPIHLHLVQFQLVRRQTLDSVAYSAEWISLNGQPPLNHPTINVKDLSPFLFGSPQTPQPNEQGWKDTITVNAGEIAIIRVRFAPQDGSSFAFDASAGAGYVWHCHLLEHEDNEMMRPYKLTAPSLPIIPVAVSSAVGTAAALSLAYYYQKKRKKKSQEKAKSFNPQDSQLKKSESSQSETKPVNDDT